jgi:hypothetical protein
LEDIKSMNVRNWKKVAQNRDIWKEVVEQARISYRFIYMIKSRRMKWAGQVARMGRGEAYTGFWWGNMRERDNLEDLGVNGRTILRRIFRR